MKEQTSKEKGFRRMRQIGLGKGRRKDRERERACGRIPGEACEICPEQGDCGALAEEQMRLTEAESRKAETLTPEETAEILDRIERFTKWAKAVQKRALDRALEGEEIPGWSVTRARANRQYRDELEVAKRVKEMGLDPYEPRLRGIPAMEKLLGKHSFERVLGDLIEVPDGTPKLVRRNKE